MDADRRSARGKAARGFTLVELMVALTILVLLLAVAVPDMREAVDRSRATREITELRGLLELARTAAVMDQTDITLCGTSDGRNCSLTWRAQPTLVFNDRNANRCLDAGERLLAYSRLTETGNIDWHGSNGRRYIRFRSNGGVKEFGNFVYCPMSGNRHQAHALIVSATGHLRETRDKNGDGIAEDAYGKSLNCPP